MKQQKSKERIGEYTVTRYADTEIERDDCRQTLRRQGCRSVRFETHPNGNHSDGEKSVILVAHGFLAKPEGPNIEAL